VYQLDATTGAKLWKTLQTAEVISSPALTGPNGARVVVVGDLAGTVHVFNAGTGTRMRSFQTGGQLYSSAAVSNGTIFIGSTDGFLYAFAPGGPVGGAPNTTISSPPAGSVPNPNGNLQLRGTAQDNTSVSQVLWALRNENTRQWWNATSGSWQKVFVQNRASLSAPGAASTNWSAIFPVPFNGGSYSLFAEAVDAGGLHDPQPASRSFFIESLGQPPNTSITAPANGEVRTFPGGVRDEFNVTVRGSAFDPGGSTRGIKEVRMIVQNLEHGEYYCGSPTCNVFAPDVPWVPDAVSFKASLASPGANSTTWSGPVQVYDHPHRYLITAWAIDENGLIEQSRATSIFCVRDDPAPSCGSSIQAAPAPTS
jgi:hypothetical protein